MQVNRQTCQACGSIDVRCILSRDGSRATVVYVRCGQCKELVACYELSRYYHHGKGIESYLRAHGVAAGDSGREWLSEFRKVQEDAANGFEEVLKQLAEDGKDA